MAGPPDAGLNPGAAASYPDESIDVAEFSDEAEAAEAAELADRPDDEAAPPTDAFAPVNPILSSMA